MKMHIDGHRDKSHLFVKRITILVALLVMFAGCAPVDPPPLPTLMVLPTLPPTQTDPPVPTSTPSDTPIPSDTPTATATFTATASPTLTNTPTPFPTNTPTQTLTPTPFHATLGTLISTLDDAAHGAFISEFERHVYAFTGDAGEIITLYMSADNSPVDPILTLYAPDGSPIATDDNAGEFFAFDARGLIPRAAVLREIRLPFTGEYLVQALGGVRDTRAAYTLNLRRGIETAQPISTPYPPPIIAPDPVTQSNGRITSHAPIQSTIERAGQVNRFFIAAEAGSVLTIRVTPLGDFTLRPLVEVYDTEGGLVYQASLSNSRFPNTGVIVASPVFVSAAGSYAVFITGEGDTTGAYQLSYGVGTTAEEIYRADISPNAPATDALNIPAVRHVWTLNLNAGDIINAVIEPDDPASTGYNFSLSLVAPDGVLIAHDSDTGEGDVAALQEIAAPLTGTYQLRVADDQLGTPGGYRVRWAYVEAAPTATSTPDEIVILAADDAIAEGQVLYYPFQATAGDRIRITVTALDAVDPVASVIDADGTLIAESDDSMGIDGVLTPNPLMYLLIPTDGTYQVRVRALGIGGYIDTRVTLEMVR